MTGARDGPSTAVLPTGGGELLRQWRQRRGRSQLDLAVDTGISARHLSFVETGRSQPSRRLLLALAEQLDVPLRERNALMLAVGYAPVYTETDLDSEQMKAARESLERLLAGYEPYPALVTDRWGDIMLKNRATAPLVEGVDPTLLSRPINLYRLALHPDGLAAGCVTAPRGPPTSATAWPAWRGPPATRDSRSCWRRSAPTRVSRRPWTITTNPSPPSCS